MHHDEIGRGWTVYDSNEDKIGEVADIGSNYVLVQKGLLFIKDIYIPLDAVTQSDVASQSVYVNALKGDLESMGWEQPPLEGGTATSGSSYVETGTTYAETDRSSLDTDRVTATDNQRLTLHEEELQAQTRSQQAGEVEIRKRVIQEQQEIEVPVTHEEVEVKRVRVDRADAGTEPAFTDDGETIRVPVTAETVEVTKTPRVVEEIEISKRQVTDRQRVTDTVRREEADINQQGDVVVGQGSDRELVGSGSDRMERTSIDDIELTDEERRTRGF